MADEPHHHTDLDAHLASIEKFFKQERFADPNFSPQQFVENISTKLVPKGGKTNDPFDPTPFAGCFELSIAKLRGLQSQVNKNIEDLLYECQKADRDYKAKLKGLNQTFELQKESFATLDDSVDKISKRTVRIGKRLETIETERRNAILAHDLISTVSQLNGLIDPTPVELEKIVPIKKPDLTCCSKLKSLSLIAQELGDNEGTINARNAILTLHSTLRTQLIQDLKNAQINQETEKMRNCVELLAAMHEEKEAKLRAPFTIYLHGLQIFARYSIDFGEKQSSQPIPVIITPQEDPTSDPSATESESEVQIETIQLDEPDIVSAPTPSAQANIATQPISTTSGDTSAKQERKTSPQLDEKQDQKESDYYQTLNLFFQDITDTLDAQAEIIDLVFGDMSTIALEMLVSQIFSLLIVPFLSALLNRTKTQLDVYLKTLAHSIVKVKQLEEQYRDDIPLFNWSPVKENAFNQAKSAYRDDEVASIVEFLQKDIQADLNLQQLEIDNKKKDLEQLSQTNLTAFINLKILDLNIGNVEPEIRLLSTICHRFLARFGEGIYRCSLISPEDHISENLAFIFISVLNEFGHNYMVKCMERSIQLITNSTELNLQTQKDSLKEPAMQLFLENASLVNNNMVTLQNRFFKEVWPEMERTGDRFSQKQCLDAKTALTAKLEDLLVSGLNKALAAMLGWVNRLLKNTQLRNDFIPDVSPSGSCQPSRACQNVCTYLSSAYTVIGNSIDGKNLEFFMQEFGTQFFDLLLLHIRDYKINPSGALVLMMDIKKYRELVDLWKVPALHQSFMFLTHVEKLYMMEADHLRFYIDSCPLSEEEKEKLSLFTQNREDTERRQLQGVAKTVISFM